MVWSYHVCFGWGGGGLKGRNEWWGVTNDFRLVNKLPFISIMISATEAKQIIADNFLTKRIARVPLLQANQCVLAQTIVAPIHTPPFNQSAMDGYAFAFKD
ncbi:MAG: hypothetical protein IPP29_09880 [Bacteroidetes bacterium]|nr:hypothetical protein [Bacteroidota bacterium]